MKILGYEFNEFKVAEQPTPPKLVVKRWSNWNGSEPKLALNAKYSNDQMFYSDLASTEDYEYRYYGKDDFQELADEFNNDEELPSIWKHAVKEARRYCLNYEKNKLKEVKDEIFKYENLLKEDN